MVDIPDVEYGDFFGNIDNTYVFATGLDVESAYIYSFEKTPSCQYIIDYWVCNDYTNFQYFGGESRAIVLDNGYYKPVIKFNNQNLIFMNSILYLVDQTPPSTIFFLFKEF